jgi:hypothetical protein
MRNSGKIINREMLSNTGDGMKRRRKGRGGGRSRRRRRRMNGLFERIRKRRKCK